MNTLISALFHVHAQYPGFFTVLLALVKAGSILLLATGIAMMLQNRSARARSWVWRIAMIMLAVLALWPLRPVSMQPTVLTLSVVDRTPQPVPTPVAVKVVPSTFTPAEVQAIVQETSRPSWRTWLRSGDEFVINFWLFGFVVLALYKQLRQTLGRVWLGLGSAEASARVQALCPVGLRCRVSQRASSPLITGLFRPIVWLPEESGEWDEMRLRAAFNHELAHHVRRDVLWQWLGTLAACAWWWLPLSWIALRRMKAEAEQAADDWTVSQGLHAPDYAEALVQIAQGSAHEGPPQAGIAMAGFSDLETRVRALLRHNPWRNRLGVLAGGALTLLTISLVVVVMVSCQRKTPQFVSVAKLVAGPHIGMAGGTGYRDYLEDFYGTIIETLESGEMSKHARERVRHLFLDLKEAEVAIHVTQSKGSAIFIATATSSDKEYTQVFLNALLDEFKAFRESVREQQRNKAVQALAEDVVKAQKDVKDNADKLASFQKQHNVVVLGQNQNDTAQMLKQYALERDRSALERIEIELSAKDVEGYMASKRADASSGSTRSEWEYLKTRTDLDVCQVDLEVLRETNKPDSPVIQEAQARKARLQKLLAVYALQITDMMHTRRDQTERRMALLDQSIAERTKAATSVGGVLSEHARLQKNVEGAEAVRKSVFDLMHKFTVAEEVNGDYVATMERAKPAVEQAQTWWGGASATPAQK